MINKLIQELKRIEQIKKPILSSKDRKNLSLKEFIKKYA